jgi:photosystem II stability/assembly factor-like uncharacterized protein
MILRRVALLSLFLRLIAAEEPSAWHVQEVRDLRTLDNIFFMNERVGWMWDGFLAVLRTTDGGATWNPLPTNLSGRRTQLCSLWFADPSHGWAAGAVRQQPTIWETTDGGSTWITRPTETRADDTSLGSMLDIRFADAVHGWAVGFNGFKATIIATVDGGRDWKTQYSGSEITGQFDLIRFWDASHGWVLFRDGGGAMYTGDGGESWRLRYFDGAQCTDIELVGPSDVWIAGALGHLIHSPDGFSWNEVPLTPNMDDHFVGWVKFADRETGWAWGVHGEIATTHDGGHTWTQEPNPLPLKPDSDLGTGSGAINGSKLFITVSPGYLAPPPGYLVSRPIK